MAKLKNNDNNNNNGSSNKKEGSSAGMFGMRDKWKKVTRAAGHKKGNTPQSSPTSPTQMQTQTQTYPTPQSPSPNKKKHKRRIPIDCLGGKNHDDSASEVDMVSIDLMRTPPMHFKKKEAARITPSKFKSKSSEKNQKETSATDRIVVRHRSSNNNSNSNNKNRISTTAISMMTPDMLETLGLTECDAKNQSRHDRKKHGHANTTTASIRSPAISVTAAPAGSNRRDRTRTSRKGPQISKNSDTTTASYVYYFSDNDTNTKASSASRSSSSSCSSSSETSSEPIPSDPCDPNQSDCLWTVVDEDEDDDENNNTTCMQLYRDSVAGMDCDPMTCVSMVLAMPVACGLVCIDNILDTTLFDTVTQKYYQKMTPFSSSSKPEIVTNDKYKDAKRSNWKKRKSKLRRENRENERHDDSDDDDDDDDDDDNNYDDDDNYDCNAIWDCKLFPSSLENNRSSDRQE
jgi:hypothetical protein